MFSMEFNTAIERFSKRTEKLEVTMGVQNSLELLLIGI